MWMPPWRRVPTLWVSCSTRPARAPSPRSALRNWPRSLPPFVTPVLLFVNESRYECDSCLRNGGGRYQCNFMVMKRRQIAWLATGHGSRPFLRAARIPARRWGERVSTS